MTDIINRYPETKSNNLKAWNAADELLLEHFNANLNNILISNDSFGFLTVKLFDHKPIVSVDLASQKFAIHENIKINELDPGRIQVVNPISEFQIKIDQAIIQIPKSTDLFELYLNQICNNLSNEGVVLCGFMTKYFNNSLLKIADKYFNSVTQSKAKKKARLLILSNKKQLTSQNVIKQFEYKNDIIKQYYGVFSSDKIDLATQFLIDNIQIPKASDNILDLGTGNGIITKYIQSKTSNSKFHLLDDSLLAIESSKLNVSKNNTKFYHNYNLSQFEENYLDWIITNPPFHFGHTIDITIPLALFEQSFKYLKEGGTLTIVANNNLSYLPHLKRLFKLVEISNSSNRFNIYTCTK